MLRETLATARVVSLPATLLHEVSHWAVARLGTTEAELAVEISGGRALAVWPPLESRSLRVAAFLAPAAWLPVVWTAWALSNAAVLSQWTLLGAGLGLLVSPSVQDVRGALGLQDAQRES